MLFSSILKIQTMLPWIFLVNTGKGHMLMSKGMEFLGQRVDIHSIIRTSPSYCTIIFLHEQWMKVLVGPYPYQHLVVIASILYFNPSGGYGVLSHDDFNLLFPDDQ